MRIDCSNCGTTLTLNITQGTVIYNKPGSGRGSKRIHAAVIVNTVWTDDDYLFMWDSPCCTFDGEPYADSYESGCVAP